MDRSPPSPWATTHVRSTSETEFDRLSSSDTLGRHYAQSLDVSEDVTLDESVYRVEPARQEVEANRSTFNYGGNPPQMISSDAARWCAQNRSAILLPVPAPAVVLVPAPAVLLAVAVPVPPGLLLPVAVLCIPSVKIDGKPKIDGNFFKSMAKSIKANRASQMVHEACTQHTGYYTSSSCENTPFEHWIEGDAMRTRIELKFRLIHQRMLAR